MDRASSLKAIWSLLIQKGELTDGHKNYYGGWDPMFNYIENGYEYDKLNREAAGRVRKMFTSPNLDWESLPTPEYLHASSFVGTFSPPDSTECIRAYVEINGVKHWFGVEDAPKWAVDLVETLTNPPSEDPIQKTISFWEQK